MRFLSNHYPDLSATIVVWCFILKESVDWVAHGILPWWRMVVPFFSEEVAFLFPLLMALWIPSRLCPLMYRVTERQRREPIALTLLPPAEYLKSQLKAKVLFALAPYTAWIAVMLAALWDTYVGNAPFDSFYEWIAMTYDKEFFSALAAGITIPAFSMIGVLDLLYRLCRNRTSSMGFILIPYAIGSVVLVQGWAILFWDTLPPVLFISSYIPLAATGYFLARNRWRNACKVYYCFD